MSKDHATSLLVLTGEESALIRKVLQYEAEVVRSSGAEESERYAALLVFNRGMSRGTERLAAEFAERMKAKKAGSR
jgi:hypothetical protein